MRLRILPTSELLNAIDSDIVQAGITYALVNHAGVSVIPVAKDHWVAIVSASGKFSDALGGHLKSGHTWSLQNRP
jgi:hypothetical protein